MWAFLPFRLVIVSHLASASLRKNRNIIRLYPPWFIQFILILVTNPAPNFNFVTAEAYRP
jgi:hypothetical protein